MKITDFDKVKPLSLLKEPKEPTDKECFLSFSCKSKDRTFRLRLVHGNESCEGNGPVFINWGNIFCEDDVAAFDENGNVLDYSIEWIDIQIKEAIIAVYRPDWRYDNSVQLQIAYGSKEKREIQEELNKEVGGHPWDFV